MPSSPVSSASSESSVPSKASLVPRSFLVALLPYLALVARFNFVNDDAFISFRYSKNLAAGFGLRYNLGVDPPVEGFSNFLWVLWIALFELLSLDVTVWARVTSIACGVVLLWRVARFLERRVTSDTLVASCGMLLLATLPPFAVWSTGGLATMPFALVAFVAFECFLGDPERPRGLASGLLFLTLSLIRADGPVFVVMLLGAAGFRWLVAGRPRRLLVAALTATGVFAVGFAAFLAWRYSYFGDLAPNTARAKVGLSAEVLVRGFDYVAIFLLTFVSVPLVALASLRAVSRPRGGIFSAAAIVVAGTFGYSILVGGDFMCMHRFLVPALPFLTLLFTAGLASWARGGRAPVVGLTAAGVVLSVLPAWDVHVVPHEWREPFHFRLRVEAHRSEFHYWQFQKGNGEKWARLGQALALHTRPGESLVMSHIGAIGYYSGLFIHDRKGLVTREVAEVPPSDELSTPGHDRTAPLSFFFQEGVREPTYLMANMMNLENEDKADGRFRNLFKEFEEDMELRSFYESVVIPLDPADGFREGSALWVARRIGYE